MARLHGVSRCWRSDRFEPNGAFAKERIRFYGRLLELASLLHCILLGKYNRSCFKLQRNQEVGLAFTRLPGSNHSVNVTQYAHHAYCILYESVLPFHFPFVVLPSSYSQSVCTYVRTVYRILRTYH